MRLMGIFEWWLAVLDFISKSVDNLTPSAMEEVAKDDSEAAGPRCSCSRVSTDIRIMVDKSRGQPSNLSLAAIGFRFSYYLYMYLAYLYMFIPKNRMSVYTLIISPTVWYQLTMDIRRLYLWSIFDY